MIAVIEGGYVYFYEDEDYAQGKTWVSREKAERVIVKDPATVRQVLDEIFKDFTVIRRTPGVA